MQHEMIGNHTRLFLKNVYIEFLCEYFLEEGVSLRGIEPHEVLLSLQDEGESLELVLQMNPHPQIFCLSVQDPIAEVDQDESGHVRLRCLPVLTVC